jgi:NAD(P)-dependent dehydrogenase (short-subunit alcohol dehydrogenase family)
MLNVNTTGTFLLTRFASAVMKAQEPRVGNPQSPGRGRTRGAIVNLGSASSFVAAPKMIQYTVSKHAVVGITKSAGKKPLVEGLSVVIIRSQSGEST